MEHISIFELSACDSYLRGRIAALEKQIAKLEKERDYWKSEACEAKRVKREFAIRIDRMMFGK